MTDRLGRLVTSAALMIGLTAGWARSTDTCPIGSRRRGNGAWRLDRRRRYIVRHSCHARWDRRLAHHPLGDGRGARRVVRARRRLGRSQCGRRRARERRAEGTDDTVRRPRIRSVSRDDRQRGHRLELLPHANATSLGGRHQPSDVHRSCLARQRRGGRHQTSQHQRPS